MAVITFIEFDGTEHQVDAKPGLSVMQVAIGHGIPGIDAECGGNGICGTCYCFVDGIEGTAEPGSREAVMLNLRPDREPNSRLGCQVRIDSGSEGIVVRLPALQL